MKKIISFVVVLSVLICSFGGFALSAEGYECDTMNFGDVTGDYEINLSDVTLILKHITNWDLIGFDKYHADVVNDDVVNLSDVVLLLKHIAGWKTVRLGHSDTHTGEKASTCKEQGYKEYTCSVCQNVAIYYDALLDCEDDCDGTNCTGDKFEFDPDCINIHAGNYQRVVIVSYSSTISEGVQEAIAEAVGGNVRICEPMGLEFIKDVEYIIFAGRPHEGYNFAYDDYSIVAKGTQVYIHAPLGSPVEYVIDCFRETYVEGKDYISIPRDVPIAFNQYEWESKNN